MFGACSLTQRTFYISPKTDPYRLLLRFPFHTTVITLSLHFHSISRLILTRGHRIFSVKTNSSLMSSCHDSATFTFTSPASRAVLLQTTAHFVLFVVLFAHTHSCATQCEQDVIFSNKQWFTAKPHFRSLTKRISAPPERKRSPEGTAGHNFRQTPPFHSTSLWQILHSDYDWFSNP